MNPNDSSHQQNKHSRTPQQLVGIFLRGMAMGAADIVPGVSGGTIALITGIYEELLNSLKSITPAKLLLLVKQGFSAFWQSVNGTFLLCLMLGILTSLLSLSHALSYLIAEYPILVWSFFFGLVAASALWLAKQCKLKCPMTNLMLIIGTAIAWLITSGRPMHIDPTPLMLFLSGALAICAMILPGISGSFILLLLGVYAPVLAAIKGFDFALLSVFALGCLFGLLSFVHLLSFLLKRYHSMALALLTGFLFGSLNALWPWKEVVETYTSSKGIEKPLLQANRLPEEFAQLTGQDPQVLLACLCACLGIVAVLALEVLSKNQELA